jgi:uncharacterized membrane protein YkvA (DUF1232 family)
MLDRLRVRARALKNEVVAVYFAAKDARTPWYAKVLIFLVVAYTLSPIDLIPDFVPVLGYLDDLVIVPAGIWLAVRMIPADVLDEARDTAASTNIDRSITKFGVILIVLLWLLALIVSLYLLLRFTKRI